MRRVAAGIIQTGGVLMDAPQRQPIVSQCVGCDNIEGELCRIWVSPCVKWRMGRCPNTTHVKIELEKTEQKVRVGQQKQKQKKKGKAA
ncbi:MAG: PxxKW family cysteine-rich protein [Desulfobacteraceae bacterium]|nr:PxxKW family cysteine-rich protein [Desulfobacteraceae bacterium]